MATVLASDGFSPAESPSWNSRSSISAPNSVNEARLDVGGGTEEPDNPTLRKVGRNTPQDRRDWGL